MRFAQKKLWNFLSIVSATTFESQNFIENNSYVFENGDSYSRKRGV